MTNYTLAATITAFGDANAVTPCRLRRLPPARGEIEVRVEAASVNPIDVRRRAGYGRKLLGLLGATRMPLVLGNDFAGIVCAVGRGVVGLREGDAVFGAKPPSSDGSHTGYLTVAARHATLRPVLLPAATLASLPYNYLTVIRALTDAGLTRQSAIGRAVLVHGATGGLGLLAVRILADWGAHVTAIGGADGHGACLQAGAAEVRDRRHMPLQALQRHFAATLNFASWDDEAALLGLLAPKALGHATTVHPMLGNADRFGLLRGSCATLFERRRMRALVPAGARYGWTVFGPDRLALECLADEAATLVMSKLATFPLSSASDAHRHVEQRRPGRAILLPGVAAVA